MTKTEQIAKELEELKRSNNGILYPEEVVAWAACHGESALHSQFEWDDGEAARQYRIWQARRVIAVYVVSEDGNRAAVSLVVDRSKGGGYRSVDDVIANEDLRKALIKDALMEFKRVKVKYEHVKELASVYEEIDKAEKKYVTVFQPGVQQAA